MLVQGEGAVDVQSPHGLKTRTIYQTQSAAVSSQQRANASLVARLVYPFDAYDRQDVILKYSRRIQAQAILCKRKSFQQNIVGANERDLLVDEVFPYRLGLGMVGIVRSTFYVLRFTFYHCHARPSMV